MKVLYIPFIFYLILLSQFTSIQGVLPSCTQSNTFGVAKDSTTMVDNKCPNVNTNTGRIHTKQIKYANDGFGLTYLQIITSYKTGNLLKTLTPDPIKGYYKNTQTLKTVDFDDDEYIKNVTFYYKSDWVNGLLIETNKKTKDLIGVTGEAPQTQKVEIMGDIVGLKGGSYVNGIQQLTFYIVKNCLPGCKTCNSDMSTCDSCEANNYIVEGTKFPTRCFDSSTKAAGTYIDTKSNTIKPCDKTCKTCVGAADQCLECKTGYQVVGGDKKCLENQPASHYLDKSYKPNFKWAPCDASCKRCEGRSTNCLECNTNCYNKEGKNKNVCYCAKPTGFYFDSNLYKPCKSPPCGTDCFSADKCLNCATDYHFKKNYNKGANGDTCYKKDTPPATNWVLNGSFFEKCHESCATCTPNGITQSKCITCNNAGGYYFQKGSETKDSTCHKTKPATNYYLNLSTKLWEPCSPLCGTCSAFGVDKCDTCIDNKSYFKEGVNKPNQCYDKKPTTNMYLNTDAKNVKDYWKNCPESCATCTNTVNGSLTKCLTCNNAAKYYFKLGYNVNGDSCFKTKPNKYYLDEPNKLWKPCKTDCAACDNGTTCSACIANSTYLKEGENFPALCYKDLAEHYLDTIVWKKCMSPCKNCKKGTTINCLSCISNYYLQENYDTTNGGKCYNKLPASNWYLDTTNKFYKKCHKTCATCGKAGDDQCTACESNLYPKSGETAPYKCYSSLTKYYLDSKLFKPCNANCQECKNGTKDGCLSCIKDKYMVSGTIIPTECRDAKTNEVIHDNFIKTCKSPCTSCTQYSTIFCKSCTSPQAIKESEKTSGGKCETSISGYYKGTTYFKTCHKNCKECSGATEADCTTCADGFYKIKDTTKGCYDKKDGYYLNAVTKTLDPCNASCKTCTDGTTSCTTCANDYFGRKDDNSYKQCHKKDYSMNGYFFNNNAFEKCDTSCATCTAKTYCSTCAAGYQFTYTNSSKSTKIQPCKNDFKGFYKDFSNDYIMCNSTCSECSNNSSCTKCKNGFNFKKGQDGKQLCYKQLDDTWYLKDNYFNLCTDEFNCQRCLARPSKCITCKKDTYFKSDETGNERECYPKSTEKYYFNAVKGKLDPCGTTCKDKKCVGATDVCNECATGFHFKTDATGAPKKCFTKSLEGYYVDDKSFLQTCNSACKTCNGGTKGDCLTCKEANHYKDKGTANQGTECYIQSERSNYCLIDNFWNECHKSCKGCDKQTTSCKACNDNYYKKKELSFPTQCIQLNSQPDGYYFNKTDKAWVKCTSPCKTCAIDDGTKCLTCIANHYFLDEYAKSGDTCHNKAPDTTYAPTPEGGVYKKCYKNCNTCSSAKINGCKDCIDKFYHKENYDKNGDICYSQEPAYDYVLSSNLYKKCNVACKTCTDINDTDCLTCNNDGGYYFEDPKPAANKTKKCYKSPGPGNDYYFDKTDKLWKKCNSVCATCEDGKKESCKTCASKHKKKTDESVKFECFSSAPNGYYDDGKDAINYLKCASMCSTCTIGNLCTKCAANYKKKSDEKNPNFTCYDDKSVPDGYYFGTNKDLTLPKCHADCKTCTNGDSDKCKTCNTNDRKLSDKNFPTKCYKSPPEGYYDKKDATSYFKCNSMCKACTTGDKCTICATNQKSKPDEKTNFSCYTSSSIPSGYHWGKDANLLSKCHAHCTSCNGPDATNCLKCNTNYFFKSTATAPSTCYDGTKTVAQHILMTKNAKKAFYPCHGSCSTDGCVTDDVTCIKKCGTGYYHKEDKTFPTNCYSEKVSGYIRNNTKKIYNKCHKSCATCKDTIDFCLTCASNYYYTEDNKNKCYNSAPVGYVLNTEAKPKLYVKKNMLKINQIEDVELKNIEPSYSGRYTMEFWMMANNNNLKNGIHVIWKNMVSISLYNEGSKLITNCWPRDFKVPDLNTKYGEDYTKLQTSMKNEYASYETKNYNNDWIFVRCAVKHFSQNYYLDVQNNKVTGNLIAENVIKGTQNDIADRYYWQVGDKTSFMIAGGKKNTKTNIYFRTIALFRDYIPFKMNKFKE